MGRRGDVREGECVTGKPTASLCQPSDVVEVHMDVGVAGTDRVGIRMAEAEKPEPEA